MKSCNEAGFARVRSCFERVGFVVLIVSIFHRLCHILQLTFRISEFFFHSELSITVVMQPVFTTLSFRFFPLHMKTQLNTMPVTVLYAGVDGHVRLVTNCSQSIVCCG